MQTIQFHCWRIFYLFSLIREICILIFQFNLPLSPWSSLLSFNAQHFVLAHMTFSSFSSFLRYCYREREEKHFERILNLFSRDRMKCFESRSRIATENCFSGVGATQKNISWAKNIVWRFREWKRVKTKRFKRKKIRLFVSRFSSI